MILILNGTSSAGKSSIARAIQTLTTEPFLHLQMDTFLGMMPPRYANHEDAFLFKSVPGAAEPSIEIRTGHYGATVMAAFRECSAAMNAKGLNVLVDDVMLGGGEADDYRRRLADADVRFIGVYCALEVTEQREKARGDRMIGLARWQHTRVHRGMRYDVTVETTHRTPEESARDILDALAICQLNSRK